jgi:hypothetical protein
MFQWITYAVAFFTATTLLTTSARAHFIWVVVEQGADSRPEARIRFSEDLEPGSAGLIKKVAHTGLKQRTTDSQRDVKLEVSTMDESGELRGQIDSSPSYALDAVCDYGVFEHAEEPMLLQYYASHVHAANPGEAGDLTEKCPAPLKLVAGVSADELELRVLWNGEPVSGAELVVVTPAGEHVEVTSDEQGRVSIRPAGEGILAARVSYKQDGLEGSREGKAYKAVYHVATLTMDWSVAKAASGGEISAAELLQSARDARALWHDFPGFTAQLTYTVDGEQSRGTIQVDDEGTITLDLPDARETAWATRFLSSLVSHRLPADEIGSAATLVEDSRHPLGRKIQLEEDGMGSVYRIRDNVVTEVNREMGGTRFTISVLEVFWNADHKYIPASYNVSTWEDGSGKLISSQTVTSRWDRVGRFDLPSKVLVLDVADGARKVRQLEFHDVRLLEPAK